MSASQLTFLYPNDLMQGSSNIPNTSTDSRCRALHRLCLKESGQRSPAEWVFPLRFPSFSHLQVEHLPCLVWMCVYSLAYGTITLHRTRTPSSIHWYDTDGQECVNTVAEVVVLMNASDDVSAYSLSSDWLNDPSRCDTPHVFALLGGLVK